MGEQDPIEQLYTQFFLHIFNASGQGWLGDKTFLSGF